MKTREMTESEYRASNRARFAAQAIKRLAERESLYKDARKETFPDTIHTYKTRKIESSQGQAGKASLNFDDFLFDIIKLLPDHEMSFRKLCDKHTSYGEPFQVFRRH